MRASSAHLSVRQPHLASEFSRSLLYHGPPATIIRGPITTTNPATTTTAEVSLSADDQLWVAREDPAIGLRGIPLIGAGPGAIRGTRPESCLDRLTALQVLWSLAATGATA